MDEIRRQCETCKRETVHVAGVCAEHAVIRKRTPEQQRRARVRDTIIGVTILVCGGLAFGGHYLYERMERLEEREESVSFDETIVERKAEDLDRISKELIREQSEIRQSAYDDRVQFDTRIRAVEMTQVSRATVARVVAPPPSSTEATATPRPQWWCYFGRECYRSKDACVAVDGHGDECKPKASAWCGGKGGAECFVDMQDCIERYTKLAFASGQLYPNPAPDVRQCTNVQ